MDKNCILIKYIPFVFFLSEATALNPIRLIENNSCGLSLPELILIKNDFWRMICGILLSLSFLFIYLEESYYESRAGQLIILL